MCKKKCGAFGAVSLGFIGDRSAESNAPELTCREIIINDVVGPLDLGLSYAVCTGVCSRFSLSLHTRPHPVCVVYNCRI